ncbi:MAG: hypothetical protein MJB57_16900, partial [Gemmatimonadetes bacterium]|nr:hypothetical protein [Gemmatimonadota bacterium]
MAPDVTEIHVGDPLRVEISVRHAGTLGVVWPDSLDVSPFEVVSIAESAPRSDGDVLVSRATLTVTAFELGELELPAISLELGGPDGTASRVFTDPVVIGVTSVGLDEGGDIRDVRGPRAIARSWLSFWPWFVLLVLAVGAGY